MKNKTILNLSDNINHAKELDSLLDLCIEIDSAVDSICKKADEKKYKMFGGNHCIQTAAAMKYILDGVFYGSEYSSEIVYGIMSDSECPGKIYNHAYLYMEHSGNSYIIDVSRKTRNALIICNKDNNRIYGETSSISVPGYDDIFIIGIDTIDYATLFNEEREFFTLEPSSKFLTRTKYLCQKKIDGFKKW